jgi:hypothetical protein
LKVICSFQLRLNRFLFRSESWKWQDKNRLSKTAQGSRQQSTSSMPERDSIHRQGSGKPQVLCGFPDCRSCLHFILASQMLQDSITIRYVRCTKGCRVDWGPSLAAGQGLFSLFPPGFPAVPQYFGHTCGRSPVPHRTGQADFPYIRLFG